MTKSENKLVAERLMEAIKRSELTQTQIVNKTGINKGALSSYINGRYKPKQKNLYLLANILDVSEAWLMGLDVPMNRSSVVLSKEPKILEQWCLAVSEKSGIPFEDVKDVYSNSYLEYDIPITFNSFYDFILHVTENKKIVYDSHEAEIYYEKYLKDYLEDENEQRKNKFYLKIFRIIDKFDAQEMERLYKLIELSFPDKI